MYTIILHSILVAGFTFRIMVRDGLLPSSRIAWFLVVATLPFVGSALYFLFGEVDLGQKANARQKRLFTAIRAYARQAMPPPPSTDSIVKPQFRAAFNYAASINGIQARTGNSACLMPDAQTARARLVSDIDAATDTVHIIYFIWLEDTTGTNTATALMRAAKRGVTCRVMVDGLGSRRFVKSALWQQMRTAGVQLAVALPIDNPVKTILTSRLDLRNHRKITVIDGRIAYCGSQNCADPAFLPKQKYGPWVDILLRLQGPVVAQMQMLFASDWLKECECSLSAFALDAPPQQPGFPAIAVGDGPTERKLASPQMFVRLIESAQHELIITTPYFVPDATVIEALCATAYRGVNVTLVFPRNNDSWFVSAASKSYYKRLLDSGAQIYEYHAGLLHAKTLTIDGAALYLGSSNLDVRSFDLNYENDVLIQDRPLTRQVRERQVSYLRDSIQVCPADVAAWRFYRRIWQNAVATIGPIL